MQVPAEQVLVIADDLDLPLGKVRLRQKGGHGGHNGLRSIGQHMQGADFARLKIGQHHLCCPPLGLLTGQNMLAGCIGQHMQGTNLARLKIGEYHLCYPPLGLLTGQNMLAGCIGQHMQGTNVAHLKVGE